MNRDTTAELLHKVQLLIKERKTLVIIYFKVFLIQFHYTFKYCVILINYMYLLHG